MFCEYLEKLSVLIISLEISSSTTIEIIKNKVQLLHGKVVQDTFNFPSFNRFKLISTTSSGKWLSLKLSASKADSSESLPDEPRKINRFACLCAHPLSPQLEVTKRLSLPSDYWYEMTDCWACHREDYTTLEGQEEGRVLAQKNCILEGISYYLVHPGDCEGLEVRITGRESIFKSIRWVEMMCNRCNSPVGEGFMKRNAPEGSVSIRDVTSIKLFKYRIRCYENDALIMPDRFSHYFVKELVATAEAHANYRFVVRDQVDMSPVLLLWILNCKSQRGWLDIKSGDVEFSDTVKLLYKVCDDSEDTSQFIETWQSGNLVEQLPVVRDCIVELVLTLQSNNSLLPPTMRFMNGFSVSVI